MELLWYRLKCWKYEVVEEINRFRDDLHSARRILFWPGDFLYAYEPWEKKKEEGVMRKIGVRMKSAVHGMRKRLGLRRSRGLRA